MGVATMDVVLEGEKHDEMMRKMEQSLGRVKKEFTNKIFDLRLKDFKSQFIVIKNIFNKVIYGTDDEELRKSRIDSAFVVCEELFLVISEPHSEIYKSAHLSIDLVSCFMIIHLGMLQLAVECYNLQDYKDRLDYCLEFYPLLIKSYIEQAISNYVKPIILNYHNQVSSLNEMEEIYYELSDSIIYNLTRNGEHLIWKTTCEEMTKDRMFYNFKEEKLKFVEPNYLLGPEPPLLCRALRYGVTLKLEDLYTPYSQGIDQIVHKLQNTFTEETEMITEVNVKDENSFDNELEFDQVDQIEETKDFDADKENVNLSPISSLRSSLDDSQKHIPSAGFKMKKSLKLARCNTVKISQTTPMENCDIDCDIKCNFVPATNYHYQQVARVEKARKIITEVKKKARQEQEMLNELYSIKAKQHKYEEMTENISRLIFTQELHQLMIDDKELYENLENYMIFHHENKRVKHFSNLQ
ncbi:unnamed protein product [Moneuplotes crassus]|uniref:Uncharacterized protein n=1 Tax=Euplotes crassus TaxID=5936 RepID=A0AAD1U1P8_EUPCR|nr:unnamed protein product [Moneuplotes crassus]